MASGNFLIPQLKAYDQWVCWQGVPDKNKKIRKIPFGILSGTYASVTDPQTWGKYEDFSSKTKNKGFVLTSSDPFMVIDLDHCLERVDSVDWKLSDLATKIVFYLRSYTEVSPSRTGVHIWLKGEIPAAIKKAEFEIYSEKRYITVTENPLMNWNVELRQEQVTAIWEKYGHALRNDSYDSDSVAPVICSDKLREQYRRSDCFRNAWNYNLGFVKAEGIPDYSAYDFEIARLLSKAGFSLEEIMWAINFHRDETGVSVKHKKAVLITARKAMS
jgi:primase-polymerase (primpol)-like protein